MKQLYSSLWPGRCFTGCAAPLKTVSLRFPWFGIAHPSSQENSLICPTSLIPHFLIWNNLALLCIQRFFFFLASSKPSHKVQDHYKRQKCSEVAHHCQLITKNPLIADIIINYIPIMTGTIGLSVFLALHWNPKQCCLVGEKTWMHLEARGKFTWATYADHSSLLASGTPCSWVGVRQWPDKASDPTFSPSPVLPHCHVYKSLFPLGLPTFSALFSAPLPVQGQLKEPLFQAPLLILLQVPDT